MKSHIDADFRKAYSKLPKEARDQARKAYELFKQNPYHPSLHFKRVHATDPVYSVRATISYRALGVKDGDVIIWFWIGHHSEYDKILTQFR